MRQCYVSWTPGSLSLSQDVPTLTFYCSGFELFNKFKFKLSFEFLSVSGKNLLNEMFIHGEDLFLYRLL